MANEERYRVLIVDDDRDWQELLAETLRRYYAVTVCGSVAHALRELHSGTSYDAAVVDLGLRGGSKREWDPRSGGHLGEILKETGIPVVFLSGQTSGISNRIAESIKAQLLGKADDDFKQALYRLVQAAIFTLRED